jgi:hypothetical protein
MHHVVSVHVAALPTLQMQTFSGSVKKPAFAKPTARQAQRFAR